MARSNELQNLIRDTENSTTRPLPAFGQFSGRFVDVTNYASVSITVESDVGAQFPGIEIQWSTNGSVSHQSQLFSYSGPFYDGAGQLQGVTFYVPVRMRFYRIVYTNDYQPQGFFTLECILRQTTLAGTVQNVFPGQVFSTLTLEGITTLALMGCQDYFNSQFVLPYATTEGVPIGGAYLIVDKPIASDFVRSTITPASVSSQTLDQGFGQSARRFASCYNDSVRGNLYLKLGADASLSDYQWKVPPRHTWNLPQAWGMSSAQLYGVWDVADGRAIYTEGTN